MIPLTLDSLRQQLPSIHLDFKLYFCEHLAVCLKLMLVKKTFISLTIVNFTVEAYLVGLRVSYLKNRTVPPLLVSVCIGAVPLISS